MSAVGEMVAPSFPHGVGYHGDLGLFSSRVAPQAPVSRTEACIVLATLNEATNLPRLLQEIERGCDFPHEVVIVDDGSTDGTIDQIESWESGHPGVLPVLNRASNGLLNARLQGLRWTRVRYAIVMDSDLQHPPSAIPEIYAKLRQGYDMVVASRYTAGGSTTDRKLVRSIISRGAAWLTHALLPRTKHLSDPLSGFVGIDLEVVKHNREGHLGFELVPFLLATNGKLRTCEIPYRFEERRHGDSKIVPGLAFVTTAFVFLRELLLDRHLARAPRQPLHVDRFAFPGADQLAGSSAGVAGENEQ
ncbi:MAG: glycosyltransferase [Thermoplasmata archaeon]